MDKLVAGAALLLLVCEAFILFLEEMRDREIAEENYRMLSSPASEGIYHFKMLRQEDIAVPWFIFV
ncbi:hypothetical protein TIFTF001_014467 [Ficus carica]|uniref:Uncharacterized protein n=1 Tax=Ficus carica TaxID=3494 RepID=A0AA87ZWV9_FICCA|nr:hypothetical protein TIFTF001_014467 [Ficus carica]